MQFATQFLRKVHPALSHAWEWMALARKTLAGEKFNMLSEAFSKRNARMPVL
jgi:hypothetical protein